MIKKQWKNYKKGDEKTDTKKNWKSNVPRQIGASGSKGAPLVLTFTFMPSYYQLYFRPLVFLGHFPAFMWPSGYTNSSDPVTQAK